MRPAGPHRRALILGAGALVCAGALASPAAAGVSDGRAEQVLSSWYRLLLELIRGTATYSPPVAARAFAGEEPFKSGGPIKTLRALGSLFPEPIHLVVAAGSSIREVSELRGKRVDIGLPNSGTRYDAVMVLAAYGLRSAVGPVGGYPH